MSRGKLHIELEQKYLKGYLASPDPVTKQKGIEYRLNVDSNNLLYLRSDRGFKHVPHTFSLLGMNLDRSA